MDEKVDYYKLSMEKLKMLQNITKSLLLEEYNVIDCVYRPFNMMPFGTKGYTIVIGNKTKRLGVTFNENKLTKKNITKATKCIIKRIKHG